MARGRPSPSSTTQCLPTSVPFRPSDCAQQVAVFRLRANGAGKEEIRAVSAVCPHLGGPIADGQVDGGKVVCPLHLHAYDLTDGESLTGQPALKVYPVEIADGKVLVTAP